MSINKLNRLLFDKDLPIDQLRNNRVTKESIARIIREWQKGYGDPDVLAGKIILLLKNRIRKRSGK